MFPKFPTLLLAVPLTALAAMTGAAMTGAAAAERPASAQPLTEFMGHVLQRNAEQLWAWSAEETDAAGDHSSAPRSDEEWEHAESDALTLQQLTYVLQTSAIRPNDPRWDQLAANLRTAATASAAAAEARNYPAFAAAGEDINARCVACHWAFAPELETPPATVPLT